MYLLEYDIYEETKKIKSGKLEKSPLLQDLSDWFAKALQVKIINFRFEIPGFVKRPKFCLTIVVDNREDYEKMAPYLFSENEETARLIASKFKSLAIKHDLPINKRIKRIPVLFYDFSIGARSEANEKAIKRLRRQIKSEYPTVWLLYGVFDSVIVFYHSDDEVEINKNNGISEKIQHRYYETLKQFDEMNYFTPEDLKIKFDSKENLDKNFGGNTYAYVH